MPSLLRGFSAPVKLHYQYSDKELIFLVKHDTDPFSRWEAGQRLFTQSLLSNAADLSDGKTPSPDHALTEIFTVLLQPGYETDKAFLAQMLTLPSEEYLAEQVDSVDVDAIHQARQSIRKNLAIDLHDLLLQTYTANLAEEPYRYDPKLAGARQLKNLCLSLLLAAPSAQSEELCLHQFEEADNMSDELSSFKTLVHAGCLSAEKAVNTFFDKWQNEALVMDKWFAVQATAALPATFSRVQDLMQHSHFNIKNPNKVRALIASFASANPVCFHHKSGQGYTFLADQILRINPLNPNIASRLMSKLSRWRRYNSTRQELMKQQIKRVIDHPNLSKGVFEIASKSLAD